MSENESALSESGSFDEALAHARGLLDEQPELALQEALRLVEPEHDPRAYRLAAAAHRKLGRAEEAEKAESAAIQGGFTVPRLRRAMRAEQDRQSAAAAAIAAEHLSEQPDDLLAHLIAAEAAISLQQFERSEELLRTVLERAPNFGRASMLLARCLMAQCRLSEATELLQDLLRKKPGLRTAESLLAEALVEARRYDDAALIYERMVQAEDAGVDIWWRYANSLRFVGRKEDSKRALRKVLELDPTHGAAWWSLVDLTEGPLAEQDMVDLKRALKAGSTDPARANPLHAALATALEREERFAEAFEHFEAANAARSKVEAYDSGATSASVDRAIELFDAAFYERHAGAGATDRSPIFILGLPRSGSTLIERILGRHSQIEAAGELPVLGRLLDTLDRKAGGGGRYHDDIANLDAGALREFGERYVRLAGEYRRTDAPFFTDKLPHNWRYAGVIRLALPNATIIDVRRDPVDCCWSNYKVVFGAGHGAANDLSDIARFYADYVRLIDHVEAVARGNMLRVRYEDVVDDVEGQTRRLLSFLGLDFEAACVEFHLGDAPVATASSEQVRRPLNREGIGAWKPYERWLTPLIEALGPLARQ